MGWVFALLMGGVMGLIVHAASSDVDPRPHLGRDILLGAVAGLVGRVVFADLLGLEEPGVIGSLTVAGYGWALATAAVVCVLLFGIGPLRTRGPPKSV